ELKGLPKIVRRPLRLVLKGDPDAIPLCLMREQLDHMMHAIFQRKVFRGIALVQLLAQRFPKTLDLLLNDVHAREQSRLLPCLERKNIQEVQRIMKQPGSELPELREAVEVVIFLKLQFA